MSLGSGVEGGQIEEMCSTAPPFLLEAQRASPELRDLPVGQFCRALEEMGRINAEICSMRMPLEEVADMCSTGRFPPKIKRCPWLTVTGIDKQLLCTPGLWTLVFGQIRFSEPENGSDLLYTGVIPWLLSSSKGSRVAEPDDWCTPQRSGTCYWRSIALALRCVTPPRARPLLKQFNFFLSCILLERARSELAAASQGGQLDWADSRTQSYARSAAAVVGFAARRTARMALNLLQTHPQPASLPLPQATKLVVDTEHAIAQIRSAVSSVEPDARNPVNSPTSSASFVVAQPFLFSDFGSMSRYTPESPPDALQEPTLRVNTGGQAVLLLDYLVSCANRTRRFDHQSYQAHFIATVETAVLRQLPHVSDSEAQLLKDDDFQTLFREKYRVTALSSSLFLVDDIWIAVQCSVREAQGEEIVSLKALGFSNVSSTTRHFGITVQQFRDAVGEWIVKCNPILIQILARVEQLLDTVPDLVQAENVAYRLRYASGKLPAHRLELLLSAMLSRCPSETIQQFSPLLTAEERGLALSLAAEFALTSIQLDLARKLFYLLEDGCRSSGEGNEAVLSHIVEQAGDLVFSSRRTGNAAGPLTVSSMVLLFEYVQGIVLHPWQKDVVCRMMSGEDVVAQINMGGGKTSVIGPLLSLVLPTKADSFLIFTTSRSLLPAAVEVFRRALLFVFQRPVQTFEFDRNTAVTAESLSFFAKKVELLQKLHGVLVVTPETLKSFYLKFVELRLEGKCDKGALASFSALIRKLRSGHLLMDEADVLLNPLTSELNFPVGGMEPVPSRFWQIPMMLLLRQRALTVAMVSQGKTERTCEAAVQVLKELLDLQEQHRVNFGLVYDSSGRRDSRFRLAVPYLGKDVPNPSSEFADISVIAGFTIISYLVDGLSPEDVQTLVKSMSSVADRELGNPDDRPSARLFVSWQQGARQVYTLRSASSPGFPHLASLHQSLRRNAASIEYFLDKVVFPQDLRHVNQRISATGHDLAGGMMSSGRFGFTGTLSIRFPSTLAIMREEKTEGWLFAGILKPRNVRICLEGVPEQWSIRRDALGFLRRVVLAQGGGPEYRALIDAGALVLGMSNRAVAAQLLAMLAGAGTQGVVFIDESNSARVLCQYVAGGPVAELPLSSCGIPLPRRFVYFDHMHTRGTDIALDPNCRAAITVNDQMSLSDFYQSVMRLRKFDKGQCVDVFVPSDVAAEMRRRYCSSRS
eukprot:m51a1_g7160 hypothetical protein (1208) ;mRNA; r:18010-25914